MDSQSRSPFCLRKFWTTIALSFAYALKQEGIDYFLPLQARACDNWLTEAPLDAQILVKL